jgi:DNA-directed RNA polymerase specialized sigma24 family protein
MPASQVADAESALDSLLLGFQSRQTELSEAFVKAVSHRLRTTARRYLPDLPDDIQEELIGETLLLLLQPDLARFDASRGSAWNYIYGFALNAAKNIRSMYGRRRKREQDTAVAVTPTPQQVSLDEVSETIPAKDPTEEYQRRIAVEEVMAKAPPTMRVALERIYFDDQPRVRVAAELKIDRFVLQRQLVAFAKSYREIHVGT